MGLLGQMTVNFGANVSGLRAGINQAKDIMTVFGNVAKAPLGSLGLDLAAVGTIAVGVGVAATKMAADYQQSMLKVQALTGATNDQMSQFDSGLKKLAMDTGVAPKALSEGLYTVISAGYQGADAMNVLSLATKDSVIGMTDAQTTTAALTKVMGQFGMGAQDAARVNGEMLDTVRLGNSSFAEYASSIVKSASSASQFHESMETMNAAFATMTASGIKAAQASTDFQASLKLMDGNIGTVSASLNKNGIAFDQTAFNAMDYGHKVVYLNTALDEANAKHVKVTGATVTASQAIHSIATHIQTYNSDLADLSNKQAMAQKTQEAWAVTSQGFNVSMQRLRATMQVVMIDIGQHLLPIATGGVNLLNNAFQGLMNAGTYVGNVLRSIDLSDFSTAWTDVKEAVNEVGQAFQVLGARLNPIKGDFDPLANAIAGLAKGGLSILTDLLWKSYVAISAVSQAINGGKGPLASMGSAFSALGPPIQTIASMLGGQLKETLAFIGTSFQAIGNWIKTSVAPALASAMPGFVQLGAALLNIVPFLLQVREVGMQLVEGFLTHVAPILGFIIPPLIQLAGILAGALAGAINVVVTVGSAILTFFTKTQLGGDILMATLIALAIPLGILGIAFTVLAVQAVATFIMSIPAMVSGFIAGAAGAWSMAAGVLALTWPILAVIAVIVLIILAVQHWGQIVGWLKTAWGAIATFFTGLWNGILAGLQAAWAFIINVVKIGILVVLAVLFAPILVIAGLFIWLYQHNTYFKMLVDAIVGFFVGCFNWLKGAWTDTVNWLVGAWNAVIGFASGIWNKVSTTIRVYFWAAIAYVTAVWDYISDVFTSAWNTYIVKPLTAVWTNVSSFFSNIWTNYIAGPIGNLWNQISGAIGGWITKAVEWGGNLIQGFVNGIIAKASNVADAVGGIAAKVLAFLGFHSPTKEGPGSEADQWAPNFVKMYASGLEAGIPKIQAAMGKLAAPAMLNLKVGSSSYPSGSSNNSAAILAAVASSTSSSSNNNQNAEFHIYLDSKEITAKVGNNMASAIRAKGVRNR